MSCGVQLLNGVQANISYLNPPQRGQKLICTWRFSRFAIGKVALSAKSTVVMQHRTSSSAWYVAETGSRREAQAQRHLERQGFASFCPRFRKQRQLGRRTDYQLAPVFPGYVFVRFDRDRDGWHAINGTTGVKRLIGSSGSQPQSMPGPAMQALLDRCSGDVISGLIIALEPGQHVRLLSGPFANFLAEVERLDDHGRVRVLLSMLGGATPVAMRISEVGPA